ncbi:hypothetical protein [Pseudomonas aeruginosa]
MDDLLLGGVAQRPVPDPAAEGVEAHGGDGDGRQGGLDIQAFVLDNRSGSIGSKGAIDIGVTRLENDAGTR